MEEPSAGPARVGDMYGQKGGHMLDILAEVCHDKLNTRPRTRGMTKPVKKSETKPVKRPAAEPVVSQPKTKRRRRLSDHDELNYTQISQMSLATVLKMFAKPDFDEVKRSYQYTCQLMPHCCCEQSKSYGSEKKAIKQMKDHLQTHLKDLLQSDAYDNFTAIPVDKLKKRRAILVEMGCTPPTSPESKENGSNKSPRTNICHSPRTAMEPIVQYIQQPSIVALPPAPEEKTEYIVALPPSPEEENMEEEEEEEPLKPAGVDHDYCCLSIFDEDDEVILKEQEEPQESKPTVNKDVKLNIGGPSPPMTSGFVSHDPVFTQINSLQLVHFGAPIIASEVELPLVVVKKSRAAKRRKRAIKTLITPPPVSVDIDIQRVVNNSEPIPNKFKPRIRKRDDSKNYPFKEEALAAITDLQSRGASTDDLTCRICSPSKTFTAYTTLLTHLKSHAGIKPFECYKCHNTFTRRHSLKYHLLIHDKLTRFSCKYCDRKFRHPCHYREHERRHTGETPFICCDCPESFKTRNNYKQHMKVAHGKVLEIRGQMSLLDPEEFAMIQAEEERKALKKRNVEINKAKKPRRAKAKPRKKKAAPAVNTETANELDTVNTSFVLDYHYGDTMSNDAEVANLSLRRKTPIPGASSTSSSSSFSTYYPSTSSEFSTPDNTREIETTVHLPAFRTLPQNTASTVTVTAHTVASNFPTTTQTQTSSIICGQAKTVKPAYLAYHEGRPVYLIPNDGSKPPTVTISTTSVESSSTKTDAAVVFARMPTNTRGCSKRSSPGPLVGVKKSKKDAKDTNSKLEKCLRYGSAAAVVNSNKLRSFHQPLEVTTQQPKQQIPQDILNRAFKHVMPHNAGANVVVIAQQQPTIMMTEFEMVPAAAEAEGVVEAAAVNNVYNNEYRGNNLIPTFNPATWPPSNFVLIN